jgi:hypothetical protein
MEYDMPYSATVLLVIVMLPLISVGIVAFIKALAAWRKLERRGSSKASLL